MKKRYYNNGKYVMLFDIATGTEIIQGINDNDDPFTLDFPSLLDVGIMGHCKHKCSFCYQGHDEKPNMPFKDYKKIIDFAREYTNQIALGGRGDPNHHENFEDIINYTVANGIVPNYTTSGIDLTDEHIRISHQCGAVAVSEYKKDYTYNAIKRFGDAGIKVNIHKIYSSETHDECMKILAGENVWKTENGLSLVDIDQLNAVVFLLFKPAGAGKNLDWIPTTDQLKELAGIVFDPKCTFKVGMDSCLVNHVSRYKELTPFQEMIVDTCEGSRMSAYITSDLKFKPCSFANKESEMQIDSNFKEIWDDSKSFNNFRNVLEKNPNTCPLNL